MVTEGPACNYHPDSPARWRCDSCEVNLCGSCRLPPKPGGGTVPSCPVCRGTLQSMGVGHAITPFWHRIPAMFAYPLRMGPLVTMISLSAATFLGIFPLYGWFLYLIPWFFFYRYAYEILQNTADGRMEPPEAPINQAGGGLVWKQLAMFVIVGLVLAGIGRLAGGAMVIFAALFFLVGLPAAIMRLAVTESLTDSINPVAWIRIMAGTGWGYLIMLAFLFLLSAGSALVGARLTSSGISPYLALPVGSFVQMYFTLIMFHLIGYVLYQYHENLGYELPESVQESLAPAPQATGNGKRVQQEAETPTQVRVRILMQEGQPEKAVDVLAEKLRTEGGEVAEHNQFRKLLAMTRDRDLQLRHGRHFIGVLLDRGMAARAAEVAGECLAIDADFEPEAPEQVRKLAQAAEENRNPRLALKLTNGFGKRYPGHSDIPANYFLAARVLSEQLDRDEQAQGILKQVLSKYEDDALAPEMRRYLDVLGRVATPKTDR